MIAYNSIWLDNRAGRHVAEMAEEENIISAEEHANIRAKYPDPFYTPPLFARIGFFILTVVCFSFCAGFFALITSFDSGTGFIVQCFLLAVAGFFTLEWFIARKHHLASGVDDALLYTAAGLAIVGFYLIKSDLSPASQSMIFLIVAGASVVRYADRLMALVALAALLALVFFTGVQWGGLGKALMPFLLMTTCAIIYFAVGAAGRNLSLRHYAPVIKTVKIAALVCLYAAGNYFVVREANHQMSDNASAPSVEIPLAWLFWIFTTGIPVGYIYLGLKKKNRVFLITGLLLIAGTVFTVRYYHSVLAAEWAMVLGGLLLLVVARLCMQYLKIPRGGITAGRTTRDPLAGVNQLEALIIDETLSPAAPAASPQVIFGGGSGGGGGASGNF